MFFVVVDISVDNETRVITSSILKYSDLVVCVHSNERARIVNNCVCNAFFKKNIKIPRLLELKKNSTLKLPEGSKLYRLIRKCIRTVFSLSSIGKGIQCNYIIPGLRRPAGKIPEGALYHSPEKIDIHRWTVISTLSPILQADRWWKIFCPSKKNISTSS